MFFYILVVLLLVITLIMIWPFVISILFAIAMVVILKSVYLRFFNWKILKKSEGKASMATIVLFLLIIVIPLVIIIGSAISQVSSLVANIDKLDLSPGVQQSIDSIEQESIKLTIIDQVKLTNTLEGAIASVLGWLGNLLVSLGKSIPILFAQAMVILSVMYVLLPRYNKPGQQDFMKAIPFPKDITKMYMEKMQLMIIGMFKGTFLIAIVQGLAMGVVFFIAGVPNVMLLTILSIFLAMIPLVGISLVVWPIGLYYIFTGDVLIGVFIIGAFILIIANLDAILRPKVVPKGAYLNPALLILSVFGGISLMGLVGILYGPVIMIVLVTSIDVYTKYLLRSDLETLSKQKNIDLKKLGLEIESDNKKPGGKESLATSIYNKITFHKPNKK